MTNLHGDHCNEDHMTHLDGGELLPLGLVDLEVVQQAGKLEPVLSVINAVWRSAQDHGLKQT